MRYFGGRHHTKISLHERIRSSITDVGDKTTFLTAFLILLLSGVVLWNIDFDNSYRLESFEKVKVHISVSPIDDSVSFTNSYFIDKSKIKSPRYGLAIEDGKERVKLGREKLVYPADKISSSFCGKKGYSYIRKHQDGVNVIVSEPLQGFSLQNDCKAIANFSTSFLVLNLVEAHFHKSYNFYNKMAYGIWPAGTQYELSEMPVRVDLPANTNRESVEVGLFTRLNDSIGAKKRRHPIEHKFISKESNSILVTPKLSIPKYNGVLIEISWAEI